MANCSKDNKNETVSLDERFEIVSLTGTLSRHGAHLHIAIADFQGNVVGGHLMDGCEAGDGPKASFQPCHDPPTFRPDPDRFDPSSVSVVVVIFVFFPFTSKLP